MSVLDKQLATKEFLSIADVFHVNYATFSSGLFVVNDGVTEAFKNLPVLTDSDGGLSVEQRALEHFVYTYTIGVLTPEEHPLSISVTPLDLYTTLISVMLDKQELIDGWIVKYVFAAKIRRKSKIYCDSTKFFQQACDL